MTECGWHNRNLDEYTVKFCWKKYQTSIENNQNSFTRPINKNLINLLFQGQKND